MFLYKSFYGFIFPQRAEQIGQIKRSYSDITLWDHMTALMPPGMFMT